MKTIIQQVLITIGCAMAAVLAASAAMAITPAEAVRAARDDLQSMEEPHRAQMRYLQLCVGDGAPKQLDGQAKALSYLVNSVSRARPIAVPPRVGPGGVLLRLDLAAYADAKRAGSYTEMVKAWEQLAEADPYFHLRTQVLAGDSKTPKTVTADGGWVDLEAAAELKAMSTSSGALLRADYFAAHVFGDRYYDWAGVPPKEADFFKLFGVDPIAAGVLAADSAADLLRSGVTRKPRRIIHRPGAFGGVWQSKDVDGESPDRDPLRSPIDVDLGKGGAQKFNFQASEFFALGSNRLWRVALYDAAGNRADTVPDKVAKDAFGDGVVRCAFTCLRCHERNGGVGGLQPFHDDQSDLIAGVGIQSYLPEVAQRLAELYDVDALGVALKRDREDYARAVAAATEGMTPAQAIDALSLLYAGYLDEPVTPAAAAVELGVEPDDLAELLSGSRDTITLAVAAGKTVNRAAWESCYGDAAVLAAAQDEDSQPATAADAADETPGEAADQPQNQIEVDDGSQ